MTAEFQSRRSEDFSSSGPLSSEGLTSETARLHPTLEGNITHRWKVVNGGRSKQELLTLASRITTNLSPDARFMTESPEFTTQHELHTRELVVVPVGVLVPNPRGEYATTAEVEQARDEKGGEPVYSETVHQILFRHGNELSVRETVWMSMKPILDRHDNLSVFGVGRSEDGLWLNTHWAKPSNGWNHGDLVAFFLPQVGSAT